MKLIKGNDTVWSNPKQIDVKADYQVHNTVRTRKDSFDVAQTLVFFAYACVLCSKQGGERLIENDSEQKPEGAEVDGVRSIDLDGGSAPRVLVL